MMVIVGYVLDVVMILSGIFISLVGFKVIKLKIGKPEEQQKMDRWYQKFGTLMKVCGVVLVLLGLFNIVVSFVVF